MVRRDGALVIAADEPWFFVVSSFHGGEHYALEYGQHRRSKDQLKGLQIFELPPDYRPTLREAVDAWKRGVRIKPIAKPATEPPKTFNSVKRRTGA